MVPKTSKKEQKSTVLKAASASASPALRCVRSKAWAVVSRVGGDARWGAIRRAVGPAWHNPTSLIAWPFLSRGSLVLRESEDADDVFLLDPEMACAGQEASIATLVIGLLSPPRPSAFQHPTAFKAFKPRTTLVLTTKPRNLSSATETIHDGLRPREPRRSSPKVRAGVGLGGRVRAPT